MFVRLWAFEVPADKVAEFSRVYGADGSWARLFRRSDGYLGTELLRSTTESLTFLTVDRWESAKAWDGFLRRWSDEYSELDRRCASLTVRETEIGAFEDPSTADAAGC